MKCREIIVRSGACGQWAAILATPAESVRPAVVGNYVGWTETAEQLVCRRELPVLCVPVVLGFRAPFQISGMALSSFVAGAHNHHTIVQSIGTVECLQVNLTPDAAYRLLRRPMDDLVDSTVAFEDLLGTDGARLLEQLGNEESWQRRFDILEHFLEHHLSGTRGLSAEVRRSLDILTATGGGASMRELTLETGLSHKRLIGKFRHEIGVPPKTTARTLRFRRSLEQLSELAPQLSRIALEAGYYDQAHFNRDFKSFSGVSPTEYLRERDPQLEQLASR